MSEPDVTIIEAASQMAESLHMKPRLEVIGRSQIERIHHASLQLLEKTGVKVNHEGALEMLHGHGCRIENGRVLMPAPLVEKALATVPNSVVFYTRSGDRSVELKEDQTWYGPTIDAYDYLDPFGGRRPFLVEDYKTTAALADALDNYTWVMTIGTAADAEPSVSDRIAAKMALSHTEKPLLACSSTLESAQEIYRMAEIILGGEERLQAKPNLVIFNSPLSPLMFDKHLVDRLIFAAEKGIPQVCYSGPQAGSTSPATLAGTVVQGSVESLFGIVLAQLVQPGAPFVYGAFATIMDMKTTVFSYGAPEMNVMAAALAQMAHYYNIPFLGMSGCSDAKLPDAQAAAEATFSCLCSALSGANLVHDNGWLDHSNLVSPEYMVLVNEIIEMVNRFMGGMRVDDDRLALAVIDKVGPGGHYLLEDHTLTYFKEIWYSKLFDRSTLLKWRAAGEPQMHERLKEETEKMMGRRPDPLSPEIQNELDDLASHWQ